MGFDINAFRANGLTGGGARPSLFEVFIDPPGSSNAIQKFRFLCMASQLPPMQVGTIPIPYFGRKLPIAGDRVYPDWTVSIMNDEDFAIRAIMESWSNMINTGESNVRLGGSLEQYKSTDALVIQYSKFGDRVPIRSYKLIGVWPNTVEAINLSWDQTNAIETFNVTFSYDYWVPEDQSQAQDQYDVTATS